MTTLPRKRQSGMTLVELLVAMIIMGVLSTMIIGSWIALSNAYSFTSRSNKQRDLANQAIARMAREIRDAQSIQVGGASAFVYAYPDQIRFYSTFNMAGANDPTTTPRLTRFVLRETNSTTHVGAIFREFPGPNKIFGVDAPDGDDVSYRLVGDVVNLRTKDDLFKYSAVDPVSGDVVLSDGKTGKLVPEAHIQTVGILLQVDLNPGNSPNYMDIETTVQPRNVRHM